MEAQIRKRRRLKACNSKIETSLEDRIGQLPDDILSIVISKLTLKEAGRTCVLSRRWKNMWTVTSSFNFDASERLRLVSDRLCELTGRRRRNLIKSERRKYKTWVDQVMQNHQGSNIDELVIVFDLDERHSAHLNKWITFALTKRVKAIQICLDPLDDPPVDRRYKLMSSALSLQGVACLTFLYLCRVKVTGKTIEQLLSDLPLLECLSLIHLHDVVNLRVVGSSLKLKRLMVDIGSPLRSIEICAPNLVSFFYNKYSQVSPTLQVRGLCPLVDLELRGHLFSYDLLQLSSCFSRLEKLTLSGYTHSPDFLDLLFFPQFQNLRHLSMKIRLHHPEMGDLGGLLEFVNSCPSLHTLTLQFKGGEWCWIDEGTLRPHQSLKVVEITAFSSHKYEIKIAKHFLKRAIKLEKLIIDPHGPFCWTTECVPGSRNKAKLLETEVPPGVELLIM